MACLPLAGAPNFAAQPDYVEAIAAYLRVQPGVWGARPLKLAFAGGAPAGLSGIYRDAGA